MTILDRRSNEQPAVPGSTTENRSTVFGQFFDQWRMDYPCRAEQRGIDKGTLTPQVVRY